MKIKIKKILFPFFKERHRFLLEKWWFRLFLVVIAILIIILPFIIFFNTFNDGTQWCLDLLDYSKYGTPEFIVERENCSRISKEVFRTSLIQGISIPAIGYYFGQFVFLKVIMDFIVLGYKYKN